MIKYALRAVAAAVLSLGLIGGVVAAADAAAPAGFKAPAKMVKGNPVDFCC